MLFRGASEAKRQLISPILYCCGSRPLAALAGNCYRSHEEDPRRRFVTATRLAFAILVWNHLTKAGTTGRSGVFGFQTAGACRQNKGVGKPVFGRLKDRENQLSEAKSPIRVRKKPKITIFGNFGTENFGNEATLQAIYFNLRRLMPEAEFACICTYPANASTTHGIAAFPISPPAVAAWAPKSSRSALATKSAHRNSERTVPVVLCL